MRHRGNGPVGVDRCSSSDGVGGRRGIHYKEEEFNLYGLTSFPEDHGEAKFSFGKSRSFSPSKEVVFSWSCDSG